MKAFDIDGVSISGHRSYANAAQIAVILRTVRDVRDSLSALRFFAVLHT